MENLPTEEEVIAAHKELNATLTALIDEFAQKYHVQIKGVEVGALEITGDVGGIQYFATLVLEYRQGELVRL